MCAPRSTLMVVEVEKSEEVVDKSEEEVRVDDDEAKDSLMWADRDVDEMNSSWLSCFREEVVGSMAGSKLALVFRLLRIVSFPVFAAKPVPRRLPPVRKANILGLILIVRVLTGTLDCESVEPGTMGDTPFNKSVTHTRPTCLMDKT